jgi:predicted nuclease of predicted toxin-antitoxin system
MAGRPRLRFFIDNCVPDSVGQVLIAEGHDVIFQRDVMARDAADPVVAVASAENDAILISLDKDFREIATRFNVSQRRLRKLSRIDIACPEPQAAARIRAGLPLIVWEWEQAQARADGRIFIVVQGNAFKTVR